MITITTTSGTEVEGMRILDDLEDKLMSGWTTYQKARTIGDNLEIVLAILVARADVIPIDQAIVYVKAHTTRIS
jgi:hypothetical protein